jgi:flagellar L-ring protein precursor FlgH
MRQQNILIIFGILILLNFLALQNQSNAQFVQNSARSLFSDLKANKVGDVVMILVVEDTKANNSANTANGRSSSYSGSFGYQAGVSGGNYGASIGTGNDFKGSGKTDRNESIRSKLSAKIVEVDKTGNLKIQATRSTKINGETQTITLEGLIRPIDINSDNAVYSYNIMDLKLTIDGDGSVSEVQEPGLITKFLRFLF